MKTNTKTHDLLSAKRKLLCTMITHIHTTYRHIQMHTHKMNLFYYCYSQTLLCIYIYMQYKYNISYEMNARERLKGA